jgi:hypothetical protein
MRKRVAPTKKARNANISLEPEFKKRMASEAYKRGFSSLSAFARYAMEVLVNPLPPMNFDEYNCFIDSLGNKQRTTLGNGCGKTQAPAMLLKAILLIGSLFFHTQDLYETIF